MFDFGKLPGKAKRAAFAAMDRHRGKGSPSGGKTGGSSAGKTSSSAAASSGKRTAEQRVGTLKRGGGSSPQINPAPGGGFRQDGPISRERAAEIMFGTRGAAARIAKANAKRRRKK